MFDGISLNARIFGSRFGQTRDHGAHTAPRADGARQQMKFRLPSFLLKSALIFYNESDCGNRVRRFTHEKFGWMFGHTGYSRSLLSEHSANLPRLYRAVFRDMLPDMIFLDARVLKQREEMQWEIFNASQSCQRKHTLDMWKAILMRWRRFNHFMSEIPPRVFGISASPWKSVCGQRSSLMQVGYISLMI